MNKIAKKLPRLEWFVASAILLLIILYDLLESKTVFPLTEGWWETYAWIQTKTGMLYEEYNVQFPPFYIWLVGVFIKTVGLNLWNIRLVMIVVHLAVVLLMYAIVSKIDNCKGAVFGVGAAATLVMLNPVYFAKDYHTVVELLIYVSTISVLSIAERKYVLVSIVCLGFSMVALALSKQNIGVFYGISAFLYLWLTKPAYGVNKKMFLAICIFLASAFVPILIVVNEFGFSWLKIFQGNDSKGNLATVLFRFLSEWSLLKIEIFASALVMYYWAVSLFNSANICSDRLRTAVVFVPVLGLLFSLKSVEILYGYALAWPLARIFVYQIFQRNVSHKYIFVMLYVLSYCGTQTAGFNAVSLALPIALMASELYSLLASVFPLVVARRLLVFASISIAAAFLVKSVSGFSYNWWGLTNKTIVRDKYVDINNQIIGKILLDSATANILRYVASKKDVLHDDDAVLVTPSIPLLYLLLDKLPVINPVLWFDVTSSKDLNVYDNFRKDASPEYIFWLKTPGYVYDGHYNLRKKDPVMYDIDEDLTKKVRTGEYKVDAVFFPSEMESAKSVNDTVSTKVLDGFFSLSYCKFEENHCSPSADDPRIIKFKNEYYMMKMVENQMRLVDSDKFVFYGLKRNY